MNKRIKWDKQELERLIFVEKLSYLKIAKLYGANRGSVVRNAAIRLGIKLPNMKKGDYARRKYNKKDLEYHIFYEGMTPVELGKFYNTKRIHDIIKSFDIVLPDYKTYIPLKDRVDNFNKDGSINNNYLPVPLKYTYPVIMEIKVFYKGNNRGNDLLYIPEESKWIIRNKFTTLCNKGVYDYAYWYNRWIIKAKDPEHLTEEEIDLLIDTRYPDKLPNTKLYIKNQLTLDSKYECKFFCIKQDLIDSYINSRIKKDLVIFNYNFDQVPEFIGTTVEKFKILYSEILNEELISGTFETNYLDFITNTTDPIELFKLKFGKPCRLSNEEFLKKAREIHGDLYEYLDNVEDRKYKNDKIRIKCKRCGRIFKQTVAIHLRGSGCRVCNMKYRDITNISLAGKKKVIPFNEFVRRCREIHGDRYEYFEDSYTGTKNNVKIRDTVTGDIFYQNAFNHYHGQNNPNLKSSHGELHIEKWLKENFQGIYQKEVTIKGVIAGRNTDNVRIDFVLNLNNQVYWIEYNGIQHYKYSEFFHNSLEDFEKQKIRDNNVRNYSNENNTILIEIPYTYSTFEDISTILKEIIIEHKIINDVIIYPTIE